MLKKVRGRGVASVQEQPSETITVTLSACDLDVRFRKPLMAFFLRRVANRSEAEDLTQEAFVRLLRQDGAVCTLTAQAYVFQVATNLLRDRARRMLSHAEAEHRSIDVVADGGAVSCALVEDRDPGRVLAGQEDLRAAIAALDELGGRTRDVFLLFRVERMKQREIGALYGISVSAVEKHVVKAAVHLAKRFGRV